METTGRFSAAHCDLLLTWEGAWQGNCSRLAVSWQILGHWVSFPLIASLLRASWSVAPWYSHLHVHSTLKTQSRIATRYEQLATASHDTRSS